MAKSNYDAIGTALHGKHFRRISDRSGKPYYIVQKREPDVCPPKAAETYYAWGFMFGADGSLHHLWGDPPLSLDELKKIANWPRPS